MNRTVKSLVHGGGIAIATVLAGMAMVKVFTEYRVAQQMAISEEYLAKYQPQVTSLTGKQINQLLQTMELGTMADPTDGDPQRSEIATALADYFHGVIHLESGPLPQLPTPIAQHLGQEADRLHQLEKILQTQPSWVFDTAAMVTPDDGHSLSHSSIHGLEYVSIHGLDHGGILALHSRLLAQSILAYQADNRSGQDSAFKAAMNLTRSMVAHPSLMAQALANSLVKTEIAVARHTNLALTETDYGPPLIEAATLDTHLWYARSIHTFRKKPLAALSSLGYQYILALPFTDFLVLTQTNEQKLHNSFYQQLTPASFCTVNGDNLPQSYGTNPYVIPLTVFQRTVTNALSMELNTLVTEAKRTYGETGQWPTVLASTDSHVCSSITWHYGVAGDGIAITLDGTLPWWDEQAPSMALSYMITSVDKSVDKSVAMISIGDDGPREKDDSMGEESPKEKNPSNNSSISNGEQAP